MHNNQSHEYHELILPRKTVNPLYATSLFLKGFVFLKGIKRNQTHEMGSASFQAKFSKKTNISYPPIHTCMLAYQGVRNVCF